MLCHRSLISWNSQVDGGEPLREIASRDANDCVSKHQVLAAATASMYTPELPPPAVPRPSLRCEDRHAPPRPGTRVNLPAREQWLPGTPMRGRAVPFAAHVFAVR